MDKASKAPIRRSRRDLQNSIPFRCAWTTRGLDKIRSEIDPTGCAILRDILYVAPSTHPCDARKFGVRDGVVEAQPYVSGFVRVKDKPLEIFRRAAGLNLTVQITIVEHVENAGPLRPPVESDVHTYDVLRLVEVVLDAARSASFYEVTAARPARERLEAAVPSGFGRASVRAARRRSLIKSRGFRCHRGPLACIDGAWGGGWMGWRAMG